MSNQDRARRARRAAVRRRRLFAAALFVAVSLGSFAGGAAVVVASEGHRVPPRAARPAPVARPSAAVTVTESCPSPSLGGQLPALVSLPVGYRNSARRYPVIYFLHGLPAGPLAYRAFPFVANELAASGRRAIVVQPQGSRAPGSDREYLDWDSREDWPQAIASDLVRCIDARYRTVRSRYGRALMGLSAGGYGAMNIGLRNLGTFAAVESWSGYFAATNPAGTQILDLGSARANQAAAVPSGPALKRTISNWPTLIAFYVGDQDTRFLGMNRRYDADLTGAGVPHLFRVYAGGHTVALWTAEARQWLGLGLASMRAEAQAQPVPGSASLARH